MGLRGNAGLEQESPSSPNIFGATTVGPDPVTTSEMWYPALSKGAIGMGRTPQNWFGGCVAIGAGTQQCLGDSGAGEAASFPMDLPISASSQMPPPPLWGNALWMQVERRY